MLKYKFFLTSSGTEKDLFLPSRVLTITSNIIETTVHIFNASTVTTAINTL